MVTKLFDVKDAIREYIRRGQADPHKIAKKVVAEMPTEQAREYAELGILTVVRNVMMQNRTASFVETVREGKDTVETFYADRWRVATVQVPEVGYVRYNDLTAAHCLAIANAREREISGLEREAKRFRKLATAMNKAGAKTAGELDESVRMEIFR